MRCREASSRSCSLMGSYIPRIGCNASLTWECGTSALASCDSIDADHYAKIRRGGQFQNILNAIDYLNERRSTYTGIRIDIHCTIFRKTFGKQQEFVDFWRGKVDGVTFNAEYYDTWHFWNIFSAPKQRKNCKINTYVQPSAKITPCCAFGVHQHENDLD